jgi:hypothetical protein
MRAQTTRPILCAERPHGALWPLLPFCRGEVAIWRLPDVCITHPVSGVQLISVLQ